MEKEPKIIIPPAPADQRTSDDAIEVAKKPVKREISENEMVMDKKDFESLLNTIKEQNKKIELLFDVADKGRLAKATSGANGEPLIKTVRVQKWPENGKFILGWKLINNQSEIVNGRWIEKQDTFLVFEDGTNLEVSLLDFYRKPVYEKAEILSRTRNENTKGEETQILKVRFSDGKVIEIDASFIN